MNKELFKDTWKYCRFLKRLGVPFGEGMKGKLLDFQAGWIYREMRKDGGEMIEEYDRIMDRRAEEESRWGEVTKEMVWDILWQFAMQICPRCEREIDISDYVSDNDIQNFLRRKRNDRAE